MLDQGRRVFIVHHNPNSRRYGYAADPHDAITSAKALVLKVRAPGWRELTPDDPCRRPPPFQIRQ